MSNEMIRTREFLYHHRTQGEGVEGVHIRGMVDGFRKCGLIADIVSPPGVDPYAQKNQTDLVGKESGLLKKLWSVVGEKVPQIVFEILEVLYNFYALPKLLRKVKKNKYAFIYERYALNTFSGACIARLAGLPLILEVNDATVIERSRPLIMRSVARFIEGRAFVRAKLIITISDHFKNLIVHNFQIPEEKILVLPNAIDPERFILRTEKRITKKALGVEKGQTVIGFLGAFVPWHGLEFLISATAQMINDYDLFLLFVGDGPVRAKIEKTARELGLEERMCITGFITSGEVPYYLDKVDICVIPGSNPHGSPMKLFEYMAMGKPIVLPAYEPLLEIVEKGKEGLFFTPNDAVSFRAALSEVITKPNLRSSLGENGKKKVGEFYTWERNAERVLDVISCGEWAEYDGDALGTIRASKCR